MGKTYVQGEVLNAADLNASFLELKTLPINTQTATYTLVLTDLGTVISATGSVNIPASVFASGGTVSIFNNSAAVINITQASGLTLYNASTSVAGSFTLNSRGICSVIFVSPTVAVLTGVGVSVTASGTLQGPVGPAGTASISAGSAAAPSIAPSTDTNTGIFFSAADTIDFTEGGVATGQFDSSGNFKFNSGYGSVATAYGCRAWVNFNGTGTVAIRNSGNITSITDNGAGAYAINFTTAMPDANYSVAASGSSTGTNPIYILIFAASTPWATSTPTTSSFSIATFINTLAFTDSAFLCLSVFR